MPPLGMNLKMRIRPSKSNQRGIARRALIAKRLAAGEHVPQLAESGSESENETQPELRPQNTWAHPIPIGAASEAALLHIRAESYTQRLPGAFGRSRS